MAKVLKKLEGYGIDKNFLISGIIGLVGIVIVLILFRDSTTRFTFVMPVFAGFIFYNILTSKDLDKEDEDASTPKGGKK